jgi:hypothetical protein
MRVVKQHPVEMLQQCSSANSYTVCGSALSWRNTTPYVSIPRLLFWMSLRSYISVSQYISDVIMVPCCINSAISTPFLSQKTDAISFLASRQRVFKFLGFFLWTCVHPLLWLFFGFNIHKWNSCFITCFSYDVTETFITTFVVLL